MISPFRFSIFFISIFLITGVFAADFVVDDGYTVFTTQVLTDDGDEGVIEQGGAIETTNEVGVDMQNSNQSVENRGSISTTGQDAFGIESSGSNALITNSGSISTTGQAAYGIFSQGSNAVITNSGLVSTTEVSARGIRSQGSNAVIRNNGSISTTGDGGHGIESSGSDALITISGMISTTGDGARGIFSVGSDAVITNSGLISSIQSFGIFSAGSDAVITNSGTIISEQSFAIRFAGDDPTLTLKKGSNLQGGVISNSDTLNLNVEKGLNLLLTLDDGSQDFGNLNIDSPYILFSNRQIAVIDQTLFHMQEDVAADISDTILGGIYHDCCPNPCDCGIWTQTVGSYRHRCENDHFIEYKDWHVGQIVGYDTNYCGATFGIFGGYLYGEGETESHLDKLCHNTYFAGLSFTQKICDACVGVTFSAGYVDWEQELAVMDNLAEGGVEYYKFDTNAALFTSEFMINKQFCCECWNPKLTFYLRHLGLYLGKDKHEGVNATIGFDDRNIDLLTTRLDVAIPQNLCGFCVEPFVGVYGRYQLRGDELELKGTSTNFDVGFTDSLVAGVIGVRGCHQVCDKELVFSISGDFDNEKSSRVLGSLGLKF